MRVINNVFLFTIFVIILIFTDKMDGEVREGFLCPICMQDLTSITQLQAHFEEEHSNEDKAVLQSLKGFYFTYFLINI